MNNALVASRHDRFAVPRLTVGRGTTPAKFQAAVAGRGVPVLYAAGADAHHRVRRGPPDEAGAAPDRVRSATGRRPPVAVVASGVSGGGPDPNLRKGMNPTLPVKRPKGVAPSGHKEAGEHLLPSRVTQGVG